MIKVRESGFLEGTCIATICIIIVKILGIIYVIPFYRMIGEVGSSLYSYAYTIFIIFLDISSAGLPIAISKLVSEYRTKNEMGAIYKVYRVSNLIMGIIAIVIFLFMFFASFLIAKLLVSNIDFNRVTEVSFVIKCISLGILVVPILSISKGYLNGFNIFNISSISQVIEQIVRIAFLLIASYLGIYIFHLEIKYVIGVCVLGIFFSSLVAYLFVRSKINLKREKTMVTNKEIIKKVFSYSIPFIIINTLSSITSFVNMLITLKMMKYVGYDNNSVEFIATSISTWAPKINMIISCIAMGMSVSLIPNVVSSFVKKDLLGVNVKLNKALQIIVFLSVPATIGISLLSKNIWSLFYGYNRVGSIILSVNIFVGLMLNVYMIVSSTLQSINDFKIVYIISFLVFIISGLLAVPLILLFKYVNIPAYLGVCVSNILGYLTSILVALIFLKNKYNFNYESLFFLLKKMIVPLLLMVIVVVLLKSINLNNILSLMIISILGAFTYFLISFKIGIVSYLVKK